MSFPSDLFVMNAVIYGSSFGVAKPVKRVFACFRRLHTLLAGKTCHVRIVFFCVDRNKLELRPVYDECERLKFVVKIRLGGELSCIGVCQCVVAVTKLLVRDSSGPWSTNTRRLI